ncbi:asparagine synthase (glutamine-hydrolyzing) [Holophaga foetida]|uniref:asparagine synthase (glutamine-hydrolyzing) n=1 Tax=Holophaga foetida TaxID=35839 RepID=UPI0002474D18|nr:asparagine synthase (glutamine-hydrolyzing) [Holophaga foetida]
MCGIAGFTTAMDQDSAMELLGFMAGELHHRGPDGTGIYLDEGVGLVNTRLAVIDIEGGSQPLGNEDGRFWVVQNGEIYNHSELRIELAELGHHFETRSDTEVILHAFEEWGPACLERFNGPFALALWDRKKRSLFLARDRFGVRPLFLADLGSGLAFASEAKALLRHPGLGRELDPGCVVDTFSIWSTLPDRSAFRGIRELPPGHWMSVESSGVRRLHQWWDLSFRASGEGEIRDAADQLDVLMRDSLRLRLRADVPVAAYLSGGLDSSIIAAQARELVGSRLTCFGIGFEDPDYDESRHQERVAKSLGVDFHRLTVDSADIAALFPEAVLLAEKPILRTAPAPMLALSGLVRKAGFKVVLTGEGADEVFAGYDLFREAQIRRFWAREPESKLRPRLFERLYPWLNRSLSQRPAYAQAFFGTGISDHEDPLYSHRIRFGTTARLLRFLDPDIHVQGHTETRTRAMLAPAFDEFSSLGKAQYLEITTFLQGYLLHSQGDRMLMGRSVEGRFPFLDHRVAEFAASLPDSLRLQGLKDKRILRHWARRFLPPDVAERPKHPYRAPIARIFLGAGAPAYVAELLEPARLAQTGLFHERNVGLLREKCLRNLATGIGETDEMALVGIVSLQLLHEQMVRRPLLAPRLSPGRLVVGDQVLNPAGVA